VDSLAAGQLGPGIDALLSHEVAHAQRAFDDLIPLDAFTRIEIDHKLIGMLDVLDRGVPGMQLDGADVD
jgi:hypothetical protein